MNAFHLASNLQNNKPIILDMNDIVSKIYFDKSGYVSIKATYEDAKQVDSKINSKTFKNGSE